MTYELVYAVTNIFFTYTLYKFMRVFFDERKTDKRIEFLTYAAFCIWITVLHFFHPISIVNVISSISCYYLLSLNYKSPPVKRIVAVLLMYFIIMGIEDTVVVLSQNTVLSSTANSNYESPLGATLIRLVTFAAVQIIANFKNLKSGQRISVPYWFSVLFIPSSSVVILIMSASFWHDFRLQLSLLSVILLAINVTVFYLYDALLANAESLLKQATLEQQNKYYVREFQLMQNTVAEVNTLKHDLKSHLLPIHSAMQKGENDTAITHIESMIEICSPTQLYAASSNTAVDSILNFKLDEAAQHGITVSLELHIPETLELPPFDLSVILGNLLDNAIRANSGVCGERYVAVVIGYDRGILRIRVQNPFAGKLRMQDGSYLTTKAESKDHGLGLTSVSTVVERHNGELTLTHGDNIFCASVLLYTE